MQELNTSRVEATERVEALSTGNIGYQSPLVKAFYSDPDFVRATDEGIKAAKAGEVGILLEDLRRQVSEQSSAQ